MRIVYHLGAHCTDEDRLVRCLLKNRALLAEQGILIPSPTRYRSLLRDTAMQLNGAAASADTQAMILEQILDDPDAERVVLSWDSFLGFPGWVVRETLYSHAGERSRAFTQIFPQARAEFHLAIRNPATFLPALREKVLAKGQGDIMTGFDPLTLDWSTAVSRILYHNPEVPLTVWCDEDTPLIWPEVLRAVSGHREDTVLADTDELLSLIMTQDGLARMQAYTTAHPPAGATQRRRVVTAFLEKFARADQIELEFEMPGWTPDLVARLTARYHEDIEQIRSMPGVQFLSP